MIAAIDPRTWFRLTAAVTSIYWTALAITTHAPLKPEQFEADFELPPWSDKVYHFGAFGLLAVLLALTLSVYDHWKQTGATWQKRALQIVVVLVAYAALDELTQPLTNRYCDVWDWATDAAGAIVGVAAYRVLLAAKFQR